MMDDIEKTKPVDGAPADDGETGAGCDVCMPPIALVGAEDYDYKYLCMPSMVRALRRNQLQRATRHRRDVGPMIASARSWDSLVHFRTGLGPAGRVVAPLRACP